VTRPAPDLDGAWLGRRLTSTAPDLDGGAVADEHTEVRLKFASPDAQSEELPMQLDGRIASDVGADITGAIYSVDGGTAAY
jgi:hypothetical protein